MRCSSAPPAGFRFAAGLDLRGELARSGRGRVASRFRGSRCAAAARGRSASCGDVQPGRFTLDVGKQFIRWGRADIIYPTDRFAPGTYLNVIDSELSAGDRRARRRFRLGSETFEAYLGTAVDAESPAAARLSAGPSFRRRRRALTLDRRRHRTSQAGRSSAGAGGIPGSRLETALSFFDGFNHLPDHRLCGLRPEAQTIDVVRVYPGIRMYGADLAIPSSWFTLKVEAAYCHVRRHRRATNTSCMSSRSNGRSASGCWTSAMRAKRSRSSRVAREFAPDRSMAPIVHRPGLVYARSAANSDRRSGGAPERRWLLRQARILAGLDRRTGG